MSNPNYDKITERVVKMLEQGKIAWRRPWKAQDAPRSITGHVYRGLNAFVLACEAIDRGFDTNVWVTFEQAKKRGGHVKQGEHGTLVIFWKLMQSKREGADGKKEDKVFPLLRTYTVFNLSQCEGIEYKPAIAPVEVKPIERAEQIVDGMPQRPDIRYGGDRAYYSTGADFVGMPARKSFEDAEHFYSVLFHELGHSTGHSSRLGRFAPGHDHTFASSDYSKEELVAEMTATFLSSECGIEDVTIDTSAAYIQSWLQALKDDHSLIVGAAAQAQRAADFILGADHSADEAGE